MSLTEVLSEVRQERARQDARWPDHMDQSALQWLAILGEEVGEVFKAANEAVMDDQLWLEYREELIQVAAVAVAAVQSFDGDDGVEDQMADPPW